ncbi:MAG: hypothetical protein ACFKPT_05260 [Gloeotrichia echinulata GP01]
MIIKIPQAVIAKTSSQGIKKFGILDLGLGIEVMGEDSRGQGSMVKGQWSRVNSWLIFGLGNLDFGRLTLD